MLCDICKKRPALVDSTEETDKGGKVRVTTVQLCWVCFRRRAKCRALKKGGDACETRA